MNKRSQDIPGNSIGSAATYQQQMVRFAETVFRAQATFERWDEDNIFVRSITIRAPSVTNNEWLAVVRIDTGDGAQVAFHGAPTFQEVIGGLTERVRNGSLRFAPDKFSGK